MELGFSIRPDVPSMTAKVPGSVQGALRQAGWLPDWNLGINSSSCEWVENRHWEFSTEIEVPQEFKKAMLEAECLDHSGAILLDGLVVAEFSGALVRHRFDLTAHLRAGARQVLSLVFEGIPDEQGQFGYTSQSRHFKPRFAYGWDWCPRFVPMGVAGALDLVFDPHGANLSAFWDAAPTGQELILPQTQGGAGACPGLWEVAPMGLELAPLVFDPSPLEILSVQTGLENATGWIEVRHSNAGSLRIVQPDGGIITHALPPGAGVQRTRVNIANPEQWFPNGSGSQPLYFVEIHDASGQAVWSERVGFKAIRWLPCEGAPEGAEPWICEVNGCPVFLQGVNWTPARLDYLSVTDEDLTALVKLYREMGCNLLRVWGGAGLESTTFYRLCDEAGLMVWQEFPLSSSGIDNWPPEDTQIIDQLERIATDYVRRRSHHVSLLLWCGGNELQGGPDSKTGIGRPCDVSHPCLAALAAVVEREMPGVRYLPTSASGPRFTAEEADFGKGLHHDVHGPWNLNGTWDNWERYWLNDDALFRSETGFPGTMTAEQIRHYANGLPDFPPDQDNRLWMHSCAWWRQMKEFTELSGGPHDLETYCAWSRDLQARALGLAAASCKNRFPRCGGFLVWMGHDCFPCPANTAVIDFERKPKPAYFALQRVFTT
jgi:beta-mannosidase